MVQTDPVVVPGHVDVADGWVRWGGAGREVDVPADALQRFTRMRSSGDVAAFARELGPLALCDRHRLPYTHTRRDTGLMWVHSGHDLAPVEVERTSGTPRSRLDRYPPAQIVDERVLSAVGGDVVEDLDEWSEKLRRGDDSGHDDCHPEAGPVPGDHPPGQVVFQRGAPRTWQEPVEGVLQLASLVDAVMELGVAVTNEDVDRLTPELWSRLWPLVDHSPVMADSRYRFADWAVGSPFDSVESGFSGRSAAEHDIVAATWKALVAIDQPAPQRLANARRGLAFAVRRLLAIGDVTIGFDWFTKAKGDVEARLGPRTHTLFGAIALQAAVALSPGVHTPGLALCSACKQWYQPIRRPRSRERHYCDECRKKGAAQKSRRGGGADRRGKADTRLAGVAGWLLKCNPKNWDPAEVMALGSAPTNWMMEPTYRCEAVEPGDPVYLWVTGQPDADPTPGVWAAGHVTTAPDPAPDWRSQHARRDQAVYVHVDIEFLDEPIPREQLAKDSRFANSEILCVPRTNSPVKLTASEIEAIEQARQSDGRS